MGFCDNFSRERVDELTSKYFGDGFRDGYSLGYDDCVKNSIALIKKIMKKYGVAEDIDYTDIRVSLELDRKF